MSQCRCMTPPFNYNDFEIEFIGVDKTNGRFGEVSVEKCKTCGLKWLRYYVEYAAFTQSGRWYRGLASEKLLSSLNPEGAVEALASLPWHFYGGSYFRTTGRKGVGPIFVDI